MATNRLPLLLAALVCLAPLITAAVAAAGDDARQVLRVGPGRALALPSDAAKVARSGALVEIDAGDYTGDVAVWPQHDLTLRGVGGRARVHAAGKSVEGKAIWVIRGNLVTIENVELSGARVADHNGAGIRFEGAGLTLRNCRLHHNEMGILTSNNRDSFVVIEDSEVDHNTTAYQVHGKLGHNIYIGQIRRFILRNTHVHGARFGHQVKSRARHNQLFGNRIEDGDGGGSYLIDIAEGGQAVIAGNRLQQGVRNDNTTAIAFASEANRDERGNRLNVAGNDFTSDVPGIFVRNFSAARAVLRNNRLHGVVTALVGEGRVY